MQVIWPMESNYNDEMKNKRAKTTNVISVISFNNLVSKLSTKLAPIIANGAKLNTKQLLFLSADKT